MLPFGGHESSRMPTCGDIRGKLAVLASAWRVRPPKVARCLRQRSDRKASSSAPVAG